MIAAMLPDTVISKTQAPAGAWYLVNMDGRGLEGTKYAIFRYKWRPFSSSNHRMFM